MGIINNFIKKLGGNHEVNDICGRAAGVIFSVEQAFRARDQFIGSSFTSDIKNQCSVLLSQIDGLGSGALLLNSDLKSKKAALVELESGIDARVSMHNAALAAWLGMEVKVVEQIESNPAAQQQYAQKIEAKKAEWKAISDKVDLFLRYMDQKLAQIEFIDVTYSNQVRVKCAELLKEIDGFGDRVESFNSQIAAQKLALQKQSNDITMNIAIHNDTVAVQLESAARTLIGSVEGRQLDTQQMRCIIRKSSNHLVIAGAGTGKTTTIVGKVKYLLKSHTCEPKDILVLSFTNASAAEMRERIQKETGLEIDAFTFHKLGLNILGTIEGIVPKITQIQMQKFVRESITKNMADPKYLEMLIKYFIFNLRYDKSEFDFQNESEYKEYLKTNPPVTLNGDEVKSYGEMDIANYLFRNGIEYVYEKEYEIDTRTEDRAQYLPDFYLPESGCYIEYFGINEAGEVPSFFSARAGKTPSEEYREGMAWKRALHKERNTTLIECFAYERSRGELLTSLEEKLKKAGVVFKPRTEKEVWDKVAETNSKDILTGLVELMSTVITLMKSNECDVNTLRDKCKRELGRGNHMTLVNLIEPIYDSYAETLQKRGEIDFNDMINKSAHLIDEGRYVNPYKYVIVDEYQDISKARYNLLLALRKSKPYYLFCVGDDWQSIYRFAGSDMDYIVNFEKYWGTTEVSKIETTYRFTDSLIDISGKFVMQNPTQIKKAIKGLPSNLGFAMGEIKGYTENIAISFMINKLRELPQNSSVFFIGRYTFDSRLLSDCKELECKYDAVTQKAQVILPDRKDLKMEFITAHRSKGLQADYVFILNNKDKGMGFPSKIQDDPVVDLLLEAKEDFPYAEERRLFYVALTRAKKKSYLVVVERNESAFANEMEKRYAAEMKREAFTCPLCGGYLERKTGPYGDFFGCSNYRTTGCAFKRKINSKSN